MYAQCRNVDEKRAIVVSEIVKIALGIWCLRTKPLMVPMGDERWPFELFRALCEALCR